MGNIHISLSLPAPARSLAPSLAPSLPPSFLSPSLPCSLARSLARSLAPLAHLLPHSLAPSMYMYDIDVLMLLLCALSKFGGCKRQDSLS